MAFSDPISVLLDGTATNLPRVETGGRSSTYATPDGNATVTISHQNGKRERSVVQLTRRKIASDPLSTTANRVYVSRVHMVVDAPATGFTDAELEKDVKAIVAFLNLPANLTKFLGQES